MTVTQYAHPEALVSTQWLHDHLDSPVLRLFDCTMYLVAATADDPYEVMNAQADHDVAHVPGAVYVDLQRDLSVAESPYRFTMPAADEAARRFAAVGIDDDSQVVLYSRGTMQWATRVWWMLRAIGFDKAAVLDGGWEKWLAEGRPVATGPGATPPGDAASAMLTAKPRPGLFVGRDDITAAIGDPSVTLLNALSAELHAGHSPRYGRPGRIPASVNVPAAALRDPVSLGLVSPADAAAAFAQAGVTPDRRTLIYCGGGIAATLDAFVLHQLGHGNVAVYDNSLSEWAADASLPMEADAAGPA